jgi:hypothetical protein
MRAPDFRHEHPVPRRPHNVAPALASVRLILVTHAYGRPMPGTSDMGLSVTTQNTMKVLQRAGVQCNAWSVVSKDGLLRRLERDRYNAGRDITHVVINTPSFIGPPGFSQLSEEYPNIEFVQLSHSGLAYLSIDKFGVRHIRDVLNLQAATHNIRVAGNNTRFIRWLSDNYGAPAIYLPNLYDVETFVDPVIGRRDHDPLRIGTFGAGRAWKNQLIAAQAAIGMARRLGQGKLRLEYYVNNDRFDANHRLSESRAELFDGLPNAKLISLPWQAWPKFRRLVSSMDILLMPSFDETHCVTVDDGIAEGVPSVVTGAMEWTPPQWWCDPWDQASVASVGMTLLHDTVAAVHDGRQHLSDFVALGTRRWIDYLTKGE